MAEGVRLPTAEELAELYDEWNLNELIDLAGDVDDHAALAVLRDARRIQKRARLARALNLPVIREERARQYELKVACDAEMATQRAFMRQAVAAQPVATFVGGGAPPLFAASEQSAVPSE